MNYCQNLGLQGENIACKFLENSGYGIIQRRWLCPRGEIDIIARNETVLIFVEVKIRTTDSYGYPAEAISFSKLKRMRKLVGFWIQSCHVKTTLDIRLDVISLLISKDKKISLEHIKGVGR